jgi:YVTN family beta-propeller protein
VNGRRSGWALPVTTYVKTSACATIVALASLFATLSPTTAAEPTPSNGRTLHPAGRLTTLGNFPTGGALTPDGKRYWAVDSGLGHNDVKIVDVRTGVVEQTLPLPGAYGGLAIDRSGRRAYVSGEPLGDVPAEGKTKGDQGDVLHVFDIDPASGKAVESDPIALPKRPASQPGGTPPLSWPEGVAVAPLGHTAVVALNQAGAIAIVDTLSGSSAMVDVGQAPVDVELSRDGRLAFVTTEGDGTVDVVDLAARSVVKRIPVGGPMGSRLSHPEGLALDPSGRRLFVAVASRDLVAVIDTGTLAVTRYIDVGREEAIGTQPVDLTVAPNGETLYVANAGEDAVAVVNLARKRSARTKRRSSARHAQTTAPYTVTGHIPTAAYPTDVTVTGDSSKVIWLSAKGFGTGPNEGYKQFDFQQAKYGTYTPIGLVGRLGVLSRPTDSQLRAMTTRVDSQLHPSAPVTAPPGSPVVGPDGGASTKIKYVFYVVRENRVYDQIFGTDPRGNGEPKLELFDDNGVPGPAGGVTPNAHKLARMFPLIDNFYADSEVSVDGHIITSGAYAIDRVQRSLHANYGNRGRVGDFDTALSYPPRDFIFDQAARQGLTFRNYGEGQAGTAEDDGRDTYSAVKDGTSPTYQQVASDGGVFSGGIGLPAGHSDQFALEFQQQLASGSVPQLNYLVLPLDHTLGTQPGIPTPKALVANNDLGLGQIVDTISHSSIWNQSVIFVVEDDAQDGADHVDSHRMPAFVISPWAKRGAVVHTRYDQYSVLRTMELILGLRPLALGDAMATPMFDAFADKADATGTVYDTVQPDQSMAELNTPSSADAAMSAALPFDRIDAVPEEILDRILWHSVYGQDSTPPAPGPNASPAEHTRAAVAMRLLRTGGDVRGWLARHGDGGELKVDGDG